MNLFYYPGACSLADHIALIEAGLSYILIAIDHEKRAEDGRDFLSLNQKGYIPALELEGGAILTENPVILNYIAERSGKLLPKDGIVRWRVLEALAYMASEIHGSYQPFFRDFPEPEKVRAREKLVKSFAILASQMGDKEFLVSDEMTIADCYLFWVLMVAPRVASNCQKASTNPSIGCGHCPQSYKHSQRKGCADQARSCLSRGLARS